MSELQTSGARSPGPETPVLTERETQVLREVAKGLSSRQIANRLAISPRTVEIYRAKLMAKTQAASLQELVRWSVLAGLA